MEYRGISFEEDGEVVEPTSEDLQEQHERFIAQFPTDGYRAGFTTLTVDERPADLPDMNETLQAAKELADAPQEQRWYGVIPGFDMEFDPDEGAEGGLSSGTVASGFDADLEDEFEGGHQRNRVVHELGHSYGLHHSVNAAENGWTEILWIFNDQKKGWCEEVAGDDAPDYPNWTTMDGETVAALGPVGDPQTEVWASTRATSTRTTTCCSPSRRRTPR